MVPVCNKDSLLRRRHCTADTSAKVLLETCSKVTNSPVTVDRSFPQSFQHGFNLGHGVRVHRAELAVRLQRDGRDCSVGRKVGTDLKEYSRSGIDKLVT